MSSKIDVALVAVEIFDSVAVTKNAVAVQFGKMQLYLQLKILVLMDM